VLDGIVLEKAGIPAVSIVTEPFIPTGQAMAASHGLPNYKFVAMPHPIANLSEAELNARADRLTDQVVGLIQTAQGE
jgi:hypothetical protein